MNYVHTLAWNLPWEVKEATESLYGLNDKKDFVHIIVDLGFPLVEDVAPKDVEVSKKQQSELLMGIAKNFGSVYLKLENIGVSQNWTQVYDWLKENKGFSEKDNLICADPDERPKNRDWVKVIGEVLQSDERYGWACLVLPEHLEILNRTNTIESTIKGIKVWEIIGSLNWAQGGFSGMFLDEEGGVPHLEEMPIYGGIEHASLVVMEELGYKWCMLPDYIVEHTDYEKGTQGASRLLREWKNDIIFNLKQQITFEEWLKKY
jgi:hypothetical protein